MLTSVQNPRIQELARIRRGRTAGERVILIDGRREVQRAVEAGWRLRELYHCPTLLDEDGRRWLAGAGLDRRILIETNEPVMAKIAFGDRTDGLVAVAARPMRQLSDLKLSERPVIAVVHALEKPGNLGAILRSADAAGVEAVLVSDARTDVYNSGVIRASTGAVFSIPLVECSAVEAVAFLRDHGIAMLTARPQAAQEYTKVDYRRATAFIFGTEASGLGEAWRADDITPVRIPMAGACDSLNVSVTAGILFFEARRQRSKP